MKLWPFVAALTLALAACATPVSTSAPSAPSGPARIPSTAIDLGQYRTAAPGVVARDFARTVNARYGAGLALSAVAGDLRAQSFACRAPSDRRGDPPDQICRRTLRVGDCAHAWQVTLYDADGSGRLARSRGLYDRACRSDDSGLLGGN